MKKIAVLGCALVLLQVGCAATTDGEDTSEEVETTEDGLTADPAKDKRCFADLLLGTTRLNQSVEASLGSRAFCKESAPRTITTGADYYYGATVNCSLAAQPSAARAQAFTSSMEAKGFYGWKLAGANGVLRAVGGTTTQVCSAYPGTDAAAAVSAAKDRACFKDLYAVERVERVVGKASNAGVFCAISTPRTIGLPGSYYYLGDIECTVCGSGGVSAADVVSNMNAAGYYGYRVLDRGGAQVVVGQSTTRDCRSYTSSPRPKASAN